MIRREFEDIYNRKGYESLAIVGVQGDDDFSIRFFPGISDDCVDVPLRSVISAMITDYAFENGWILAHSHTNASCHFSEADIAITCTLAWISRAVDSPLVDHWLFDMENGVFISASVVKPTILDPKVQFGL